MSNNLYGGITYSGSPLVFDKIYPNYKEALQGIQNGEVFIGRYIFIKYCDETLGADLRKILEFTKQIQNPDNPNEQSYLDNLEEDNWISSDRKVYMVKYSENNYELEEITNLNITLTNESLQELLTKIDNKQDKLSSGENIKTINGESVLGSGDIEIQMPIDENYVYDSDNAQSGKAVAEAVSNKSTVHSGSDIDVESSLGTGYIHNIPINGTAWVPPYKVGDLYYNTETKRLCECVEAEKISSSAFSTYWKQANPTVDYEYNSESENAQSGIAVAEAVVNKTTIYFGIDIDVETATVKSYKIDGLVENPQLRPSYKIGDLYFNYESQRLCECVYVERSINYVEHFWKQANPNIDQTYNPESQNAQSGKAVAQAINEAVIDMRKYIEDYIGEALGGDY